MSRRNVKVVLNSEGIRNLMKSEEVESEVSKKAANIQKKCGSGYETDTYQAGTRVIASVYTEDPGTIKDCLENNTLLKAVSGS